MMQRLRQLTLDLFERFDPQARQSCPAAPLPKNTPKCTPLIKIKEKQPFVLAFTARDAIKNEVAEDVTALVSCSTTQPLNQMFAPVAFRHPLAAHETMLGSVLVAYAFRRSKRRTIGFMVGPDGLTVTAPPGVPLYEVGKAVLEKSVWILQKLHDMRSREQQLAAKRVDWANGCRFAYLGQTVTVLLNGHGALGAAGAVLHTDADDQSLLLHTGLPQTATPEHIKNVVRVWMIRQAQLLFTERLAHFSPMVGVQYKRLGLSSANTRWGSASADGSIRLNWRLMHFCMPIIDYVVVHELSHLRVMNHSPLFWDTVRAVVPDYAALRAQLRNDPVPSW